MKTRFAFVSNSSSTSFVVTILKTVYEKERAKLSKRYQEVLSFIEPKEGILGKERVTVLSWADGNDSPFESFPWDEDKDYDEEHKIDRPGSVLTFFVTNCKKTPGAVIETQQAC